MRRFPIVLLAFALTALYTIRDLLPPAFAPIAALFKSPAKLTTWVAHRMGFSGEVYDSLPVIFAVNLAACVVLAVVFSAVLGRKR